MLRVADAAVLVVSATGAVVGNLNARRSHIAGVSPEDGIATIEASMPQVEAQQYSTQLRTLTHGRGAITMEFDHCGEVPANLVPKILAAHEAENAANGPV